MFSSTLQVVTCIREWDEFGSASVPDAIRCKVSRTTSIRPFSSTREWYGNQENPVVLNPPVIPCLLFSFGLVTGGQFPDYYHKEVPILACFCTWRSSEASFPFIRLESWFLLPNSSCTSAASVTFTFCSQECPNCLHMTHFSGNQGTTSEMSTIKTSLAYSSIKSWITSSTSNSIQWSKLDWFVSPLFWSQTNPHRHLLGIYWSSRRFRCPFTNQRPVSGTHLIKFSLASW